MQSLKRANHAKDMLLSVSDFYFNRKMEMKSMLVERNFSQLPGVSLLHKNDHLLIKGSSTLGLFCFW